MAETLEFAVVITGGGLTGLALAAALAPAGVPLAIVDSKAIAVQEKEARSEKELRALAISYTSQQILTDLGVWQGLEGYAVPIKQVHISDQGHFGFARIKAADYQLDRLGAVVPMARLQAALLEKVTSFPNVCLFSGAKILKTYLRAERRWLELDVQDKPFILKARLIVAADGSSSLFRNLVNIKLKHHDYQQTAVVANIGVKPTHHGVAFERFTHTGPLALLPISSSAYSLVWTLTPETADSRLKVSDAAFLAALQQAFGYRLGKFEWVGERQSFPLSLSVAESFIAERSAIIGNAAHTLHPIAGQGFNLGLRDAAVLARHIKQAVVQELDFGSVSILEAYQAQREKDTKCMVNLTHNLVKLFANNSSPLCVARNLGLLGFDLSPFKTQLARKTMGFIPIPLGNAS